MESVFDPLIALVALTAMEIVLGIDNIVFIAIVTGKLPQDQQPLARRLGLALAMICRIALLATLSWVMQLKEAIFLLSDLGFYGEWLEHKEVNEVSIKDLILLAGGLFLIYKSVVEIHHKVAAKHPHEDDGSIRKVSFANVIFQIAILDIIFSLDSVITAVGMADDLYIMIVAVILAVIVMLIFSERVSAFVAANPTVKVLALSFLILIGVMLVAESMETAFDKGYVYFAMAFALVVELLNLRVRIVQFDEDSEASSAASDS